MEQVVLIQPKQILSKIFVDNIGDATCTLSPSELLIFQFPIVRKSLAKLDFPKFQYT